MKPDTTKLVLSLPGTTCTQCTRTHVQLSRSAYSRDRTTRTESHEELFSVKIRDSIYIIQYKYWLQWYKVIFYLMFEISLGKK